MPKNDPEVTSTVQVTWPIPTNTSVQEVMFNLLAIMRGQYPGKEVKVFSIISGNIGYKGLVFQDVHNPVTINCYSDQEMLKEDYLQIIFAIKAK